MKLKIALPIVFLVAVTTTVLLLLFTGPRMKEQPHLLAYQDTTAAPAPGAIPVEGAGDWPQGDSSLLKPPQTSASTSGKVYYGYYCAFCHGDNGDGNGPVGQSIVPKPADLREQRVKEWSDSQLVNTMFNGDGHTVVRDSVRKPVLARMIPPGQVGEIVRYVRELGHH